LATRYVSQRKELIPFVPDKARRIIDVGCSTGQWGALLKSRREIEIWGVEPDTEAAEIARRHLDVVHNALFEPSLNLPTAHFDAVFFNDSLEHFPDTDPPLRYAKTLLNESGIVVASIPNVRYLENVRHFLIDRDWRYEDEGILDRTHLRFFTLKSMKRTFEEAGYDVLHIAGINPHYWSGKTVWMLKTFLNKWVSDMKYQQYVVQAKPMV